MTHCFPGPVPDGLDVHQAGPGYVSGVRAPQGPQACCVQGGLAGPRGPRGGPSLLTPLQPPQKRGTALWLSTFLSGVDSPPALVSLARARPMAMGTPPAVPPGGPRSLGASSADTSAAGPTEHASEALCLGRPQRGSRSHRPRWKPNPPGATVARCQRDVWLLRPPTAAEGFDLLLNLGLTYVLTWERSPQPSVTFGY